jgi:hypothetical protein
MKLPRMKYWIAILCIIFFSLGCNLSTSVKYADNLPATPQVKVDNTAVPLPDTPLPPPMPTKSRLHWGTYLCVDNCISDKFLESYPVIGGVPPLTWAQTSMSVSVNQDGTITTGFAFFWIFTNSDGGEVCTNGEYQFDGKITSGSYNSVDNILSVEMTGDETYGSDVGGEHCMGADLEQQGTHQFVFAVDGDGNLVLCNSGETGEACLQNPIAILK